MIKNSCDLLSTFDINLVLSHPGLAESYVNTVFELLLQE